MIALEVSRLSDVPIADVPIDRVVQVRGADAGRIAVAIAEQSSELAAVVLAADARWASPQEFVGSALTSLEKVAVELLPAWLPDAADVGRLDIGGTAAIRIIAGARAAQAHYSRSFLLDLAILALTGHRDGGPGLPAGAHAAQLARLVAESFGRGRCVLLVPIPAAPTGPQRDAIVTGADWLTHNARVAVWLLGTAPLDAERVPLADLGEFRATLAEPMGKPHPASAVEAALEAALAGQSWAAGRRWNQVHRSSALSSPVRLDLLWPDERCVVELDGPEHCHPVHFEADRQRDVQLQLDGYAVLRFTNARVVHDMGAVVHQIGAYIRGRRRDYAEGN